ncbi:hypothetical protein [Sabulicella glaciei]|uniref:DUF4156 domain-containing protein n=1 Tax=Sabulicella glaciei TaxID=2984948 RepID=A0ABT3NQR8_9PROT|nr:hypothetical protein [Roseococcus sp. MDT2-1-1]MCW8084508.1 hypothetical protein [Roseococcus sp. MDT2-1-1]
MSRASAPFALLILLAACAETAVVQLGANRYRATTDNTWTAGGAETQAIQSAQAHCAQRGLVAEANVTASHTASYSQYGRASVEFSCVQAKP